MHVLVGTIDERGIRPAPLAQLHEDLLDVPTFLGGKHARVREGARPRDAAGHIVLEEPAIETERRAKLERGGVGRRVESSGPES